MKKTLFITFEGIDGSGKSTQIKLLKEYLDERNIASYTTREPGGTPLAEGLRNVLLDNNTGELSPYSELFLYLASRREHLDKIILPNLRAGKIVISDRFVDSSVAYQGSGRGIELSKVDELNQLATDGNYPDITFLLDISPKEGLSRVAKSKQFDRLENEGIEFLERIRDGYLWIAKRYPKRVRVIDATLQIETVFKQIIDIIEPELTLIDKEA